MCGIICRTGQSAIGDARHAMQDSMVLLDLLRRDT
jgi:hypothetical protein